MITLRNDPTDVRAVLRFVRELPRQDAPVRPPDHASVDRGITGPNIRDHDQLGELREYSSPWGRIEVSSRGNVVRMVATAEPHGAAQVNIAQARDIATEFMQRVVEDATERNFEAEAAGDGGGLYEFRWIERPRPGQYAIFPNEVTVRVLPQNGLVASYFATDVRAYRTVPPQVDETSLAAVVAELVEHRPHHVRRIVLVEDTVNGGMGTRTVYRVAVAVEPDDEVLHFLVDADSGARIVQP